jgi:hypothetical protein
VDLSELPSGNLLRRHPWELARFEFFERLLADHALPSAGEGLLDVGAGDGWFTQQLVAKRPCRRVFSWDAYFTEDQLRSLTAIRPDIHFTRVQPSEPFALVLLLDVLEHVGDDRGFLGGIVEQNVPPGGHLLISVPAWPSLFSKQDVALKHLRRYTPGECRRLIDACGLEVVTSGGLFHSLLVPRLGQRLLEALHHGGEADARGVGGWRAGPVITALVQAALTLDIMVSLLTSRIGWSLPGLSWWALCRKPS